MLQHVTKLDPMALAGVLLLLGLFASLMISESVAQTPNTLKVLPDNTLVIVDSDGILISPHTQPNNADMLLQQRTAEVKEN